MSHLDTYPWVAGDLQITSDALAAMHQNALYEYPNECCGYISGPADKPGMLDTAVAMQNLAITGSNVPALPAERTSQDYFVMDPLKVDRAIEDGEESGHPVKVIYHSHPNCKGGYFSEEDRRMFGEGEGLSLPVSFIVIGVDCEQSLELAVPVVIETRLWVFDSLTKIFIESQLSVLD